MKRLLEVDDFTGIVDTFEQDPMTGKISINKTQEVGDLLDLNQAERLSNSGSFRGDMHKVASIPLIFIDQWREELKAMGAANINPLANANKAFFVGKLNSRNWAKLRTKEGRI